MGGGGKRLSMVLEGRWLLILRGFVSEMKSDLVRKYLAALNVNVNLIGSVTVI